MSRIRAQQTTELTQTVASLKEGPGLLRLRSAAGGTATMSTGLVGVLTSYDSMRSAIMPVVVVAAFGIGTVAVVVLCLAGGLIARRRTAELVLLRARGASLAGMGGRLLGETAVIAVPAGAGGLCLAVLVVGEARLLPAVLAAAAVTAVACAALPLQAIATHRRPRAHGERDDLVSSRPTRRRAVGELTLLTLTAGAVVALRQRGAADAGDYLVSAAPVLVGLVAALVLVRLYPLPLRWAAQPAKRLRGGVGFLSLARAGRAPSTGALSLLVLLVTFSTAAFGASVLTGVADTRDREALLTVRADARVTAAEGALPDGADRAVEAVPGVRSVTALRIEQEVSVPGSSGDPVDSTLIGVDPDSYARLSRDVAIGAFPAGALTPPGRGPVVPVVASPRVAAAVGHGTRTVKTLAGTLTIRVAAVRSETPGTTASEFMLVDRSRLPETVPTGLLVSGDRLNGKALRAAVGGPGAAPTVDLRSEARARFADSPLQAGAERIYTVAIGAGALYALLAVLLTVLQTSPERATLLARLRTMGFTTRQGQWLIRLETLPQSALAAIGGALVGWATVALLAPGIDVLYLALGAAPDIITAEAAPLRAGLWALVLPAVGVVLLTTTVAAVQAWWAGRRGPVNELRAGDAR